MRISHFKRVTALVMALFMVIPCFTMISFADETGVETATNVTTATFEEFKDLLYATSYDEYLNEHSGAQKGKDNIVIKGYDYDKQSSSADESMVCVVDEGSELYDEIIATDPSKEGEKFLYTSDDEGCTVTWKFNVKTPGMYNISLEYYPVIGRHSAIERRVMIDSEYPFKEARYVNLSNIWRFHYVSDERENAFFLDLTGNEIRPAEIPTGYTFEEAVSQFGKAYREEAPEWRTVFLSDSTGYYREPFEYYLEAGEHTISLVTSKEQLVVNEIKVYAADDSPTYEEYLEKYASYNDVEDVPENYVKIHAELQIGRAHV